jgi:hypothetical protein
VAALAATAAPAAPAAASPPACQTAGLVVWLANGSAAAGVLAITDVYNYPASVCHRVTAAGLRVIPPNQFASKLVPYPIGACSTRQVFMQAGAVHKQR